MGLCSHQDSAHRTEGHRHHSHRCALTEPLSSSPAGRAFRHLTDNSSSSNSQNTGTPRLCHLPFAIRYAEPVPVKLLWRIGMWRSVFRSLSSLPDLFQAFILYLSLPLRSCPATIRGKHAHISREQKENGKKKNILLILRRTKTKQANTKSTVTLSSSSSRKI